MIKNKTLLTNIFSLLILQGTTYILPLLTFPYLVRTLGEERFGVLIFSAALIQYFVIFCDFGFNFTSTRKISLNREDRKKVSEIFSTTMSIKWMMTIISFFILLLIVVMIPKYSPYMLVFIVNFIQVVGNVLFPVWFYQGIEKMKFITIINVISRVLTTASIFLFVKDESDYVLAVFLQSVGFLLSGIIAFAVAVFHFSVKPRFIMNLNTILEEGKESWKVFVSTLSINVYNQGSVLILGLFTNNTIVGYFGIAQKIVHAVTGLSQPFAQAIYPYLCKLFIKDVVKYTAIVNKLKAASIGGGVLMGLIIYIFADFLTVLVTGKSNQMVVDLLSIWSIIAVCIFNNIVINTFVLSMGKYSQMQKMYVSVSILFLIVSIPFTYVWNTEGMSLSLLLVELFIFISSLYITRPTANATIAEQN